MLGEQNGIDKKLLIIGAAIIVAIIIVGLGAFFLNANNNNKVMSAFCGDNVCNGTETEANCPKDCSIAEEIPLPNPESEEVIPNFP